VTATTVFSPEEVAALAERLGVTDAVAAVHRYARRARARSPRSLTNVTDDDPLLTAKIALAHLRELPDYYTRLAAMEAAGEGRPPRVRDLMSLEPVTIRNNAPLVTADRLMRQFGVSGLPVIDHEGALVLLADRLGQHRSMSSVPLSRAAGG
jgi:CBS domain-containing protein